MVVGPRELGAAVRVDLRRFHETWMELFFPRQRQSGQSVLGRYTPDSTIGTVAYRLWSLLGAVVVGSSYPLVVAGYVLRYQSRRLNTAATRLGLVGVVVLTALVWGSLTVATRLSAEFSRQGFLAVAAASVVATVSSALSMVFVRVDGRPVTVLVAAPFGVTAITLPPVVAAFFSPTLAGLVFSNTETIAAGILDSIGDPWASRIRQQFDLTGIAYVIVWFGFSVPIGWAVGLLVTLADLVRPTE
jgi:hypothetical protein